MSEERTELQELLAKEGYTGLTSEERERALGIISKAEPTSQPCWICKKILKCDMSKKDNRAICNTGLCKHHARYVLLGGK